MMNFTILKVCHAGELEARKVIPYINRCHVFGFEAFPIEVSYAELQEQHWNTMISDPKFLRSHYNQSVKPDVSPIEAYIRKVKEYLFRSKRPLFYLERNNDSDCQTIENIVNFSDNLVLSGMKDIRAGNEDEGIEKVYRGLEVSVKAIKIRDAKIASNLLASEEYLKRTYPSLAELNSLDITFFVGAVHEPENHGLGDDCKIVDLSQGVSIKSDLNKQALLQVKWGMPLIYLKDLILEMTEHEDDK